MKDNKINWKKIGLSLIYPHIAVIICLLPFSVAFLVLSLVHLGNTSAIAIISYLIAFYLLVVICFRIPRIIAFFKKLKRENRYLAKWFSDVQLRMNVSLYGSLIWNVVYALFQLILGILFGSFWYYSMSAYYIMLGVIRFFLLKHTRKYKPEEQRKTELKKFVASGYLLLAMNLALSIIVFFIVYWNKTFYHDMITTICMATYTFFTFIFAIVNLVRYRKYNSPVYSAAKTITLIAGAVSMLTLETTMLTTFATSESANLSPIMLSLTGVAVIGFAISVAIIMIVKGSKNLKKLKNKDSE